MGATHFTGPLITGDRLNTNGAQLDNTGVAVLTRSVTLTQNGTAVVSGTINVPKYSRLIDILVDTLTAFDSGTSATLSVGTTAAGTQYAGSVDVKTAAGRQRPTFTGAQLLAMDNVTINTAVVASVTPVGATSAGSVKVTYLFEQTTRTA